MCGGSSSRRVGRLLVACTAALLAAIAAAVFLAVADVAITGHGGPTIRGRLVDWPALGVHLGPADILLLAVAAAAFVIAWRRPRRDAA